jgi:hypothetical protein
MNVMFLLNWHATLFPQQRRNDQPYSLGVAEGFKEHQYRRYRTVSQYMFQTMTFHSFWLCLTLLVSLQGCPPSRSVTTVIVTESPK